MSVYDIALAFVRVWAAVEFVRAVISLVFATLHVAFVESGDAAATLQRIELTRFLSPIELAVTGLILLAIAKPLARLIARNAPASHF